MQGPSVLLGVSDIASVLKFSGCPKNVGSGPNRIFAPLATVRSMSSASSSSRPALGP